MVGNANSVLPCVCFSMQKAWHFTLAIPLRFTLPARWLTSITSILRQTYFMKLCKIKIDRLLLKLFSLLVLFYWSQWIHGVTDDLRREGGDKPTRLWQEEDTWRLGCVRTVFSWMPKIICVCFGFFFFFYYPLWLVNNLHHFPAQPMRSDTKSNRDLLSLVFPPLKPVTCICFEFLLVHCAALFTVWFYDIRLKSALKPGSYHSHAQTPPAES